jgi:hypothetical protein
MLSKCDRCIGVPVKNVKDTAAMYTDDVCLL